MSHYLRRTKVKVGQRVYRRGHPRKSGIILYVHPPLEKEEVCSWSGRVDVKWVKGQIEKEISISVLADFDEMLEASRRKYFLCCELQQKLEAMKECLP